MTVKEAERAFEEMLPCETTGFNALYMKNLGRPIEIRYKKGGSMLTNVSLVFGEERCLLEVPIEKLKLTEE